MHYKEGRYLGERPLLLQIYKKVELHQLSFYISDCICKNLAIEISLICLLSGFPVAEGIQSLIYLIATIATAFFYHIVAPRDLTIGWT